PGAFLLLSLNQLLNNSGETIKIYINSSATTALLELSVPAAKTGQSYARTADGSYSWNTPTPGAENVFSVPPPDPLPLPNPQPPIIPQNSDYAGIILSEVDLESEFLEIQNIGTNSLDLSSFQFSELSGTVEKKHAFSEFIS